MSRLHPNIPFREAEGLNEVIYDVAKVPAVITEAVENFRDTSYDVIYSFFVKVESMILQKSISAEVLKIAVTDSVRDCQNSFRSIVDQKRADFQLVVSNDEVIAAIFDMIRRVFSGISSSILEDDYEVLEGWLSSMITTRVILHGLRLDRLPEASLQRGVPSKSEILSKLEDSANIINSHFRNSLRSTSLQNTVVENLRTATVPARAPVVQNFTTEDDDQVVNLQTTTNRSLSTDLKSSFFSNLKLSKELPSLSIFNPKKDTVEVFKQKIRQELKSNLLEMDENPQLSILYLMRFLSPETKELLDISSIPGAKFSDQDYIDAIDARDYNAQLQCIFRLLQNSYDANESKKDLLLKWETAKQENSETVAQFCNRLLYLQDRLVRAGFGEKSDTIIAIKLQAGCKESLQRWMKTYVNDQDLDDFQRLRDRLIRYEANALAESKTVIDLDAADFKKNRVQGSGTSKNFKYKNDLCNRCGARGHYASDCPAPKPCHQQDRCYTCSGVGHKSDKCFADPKTLKCSRCGRSGHTAPVCMAKFNAKAVTNTAPANTTAPKTRLEVDSLSYDLCQSDFRVADPGALQYLNLFSNGEVIASVLVDSGAELSITTPSTLNEWANLNVPICSTDQKVSVRMANGVISKRCPVVLVTVGLHANDSRQIPMAVLHDCTKNCILSFNVLRATGIIWIATQSGDKLLQVPEGITIEQICDAVKFIKTSLRPRRNSCPDVVTSVDVNCSEKLFEPNDEDVVVDSCRIEVLSDESDTCELFTISTSDFNDRKVVENLQVERFRFRVPWISDKRPAFNRSSAESFSKRLEQELSSKGMISDYDKEIDALIEIDAIVEVSPDYIKHFLPHFGVSTKQGSSMRTRPVFNCISLNRFIRTCKVLHKTIVPNLFTLLRFKNVRLFDFSKAFLRLEYVDDGKDNVDELLQPCSSIGQEFEYADEDAIWTFNGSPACPYMGFVWKGRYYCFKKVLMGGTGSPSHLQRAVDVLKNQCIENVVSTGVSEDSFNISIFMDDGILGSDCVTTLETVTTFVQMEMMKRDLPDNEKKRFGFVHGKVEVGTERFDQTDPKVKSEIVMGFQWNLKSDSLCIVKDNLLRSKPSQSYEEFRSLSAKLFDPLGFYLEYQMMARKILRQSLTETKFSGETSADTIDKMRDWYNLVLNLNDVPRLSHGDFSTFFVFCDASSDAFAAIIETQCDYRILARGRLFEVPHTQSSVNRIPRKELNALVLGCEALLEVIETRVFYPKLIVLTTDSEINFQRLKSSSKRKECTSYEYRRLINIRNLLLKVSTFLPNCTIVIRHVPGALNCADAPSRCKPADHGYREQLSEWKGRVIQLAPKKLDSVQITVTTDWLSTLETEQINKTQRSVVNTVDLDSVKIGSECAFNSNYDISVSYHEFSQKKRTFFSWNFALESGFGDYSQYGLLLYLVIKAQNVSDFCTKFKTDTFDNSYIGKLRLKLEFTILDNVVYKRYADRSVMYVPDNEKVLQEFITLFLHKKLHSSAKNTEIEIRKWFYFKNISKICNSVCKKCNICSCASGVTTKYASITNSTVLPPPWSVVGIDHCGPYAECSDSSHRVVLVVTCLTTGFIACESLKSCDTLSTIGALSKIFWTYGFPKWVKSDNGSSFRSKSMVEYLTTNGVKITYSPPRHPESGGKWEASHKSFNHNLTLLTNTRNVSWTKLVKEACFISNAKPRYSFVSSFELFHTFVPRHPLMDVSYSSDWQNSTSADDFRSKAKNQLENFLKLDFEKQRDASKRTKNSKALASDSKIEVGDEVYLKRFGEDKLSFKFQGPFIVFSKRGGTVAVRDRTSTERLAHIDNLKLSVKNADPNVNIEKLSDVEARLWSFTDKPNLQNGCISIGSKVRWAGENDMFHVGEVRELTNDSALIHRFTVENEDVVPSYVKYNNTLHPNFTYVSTEILRPFQFTRGSLLKIILPKT